MNSYSFFAVLMLLCAEACGADVIPVVATNMPALAASNVHTGVVCPPPKFAGIKQKPVNYRVPLREYVPFTTNGWSIMAERQLTTDDANLTVQAVSRLALKLDVAVALLPETCRTNMRNRKIFLMYGPKAKSDGRDNGAEYYQVHAPNCYTNLDTRWGRGIVVYSAENYVWQTDFWALKLIFHELAHVYHLEQWPEDQEDICRAYEKAVSKKLYIDITDEHGKIHRKAYAMQNPMEYFAELSCMYFTGCNYPPRDRRELKTYDPEGYAMIQKLWKVKD